MHERSQYWFSNEYSNKESLTKVVDYIKRYVKYKTFGVSDEDVKDIAQSSLCALIKCAIGKLNQNNYEHILLSGGLKDYEFKKYLKTVAIHEIYKMFLNVKFIIPDEMHRIKGSKYRQIYHEVYDSSGSNEDVYLNHIEGAKIDLETEESDAIIELAEILKSIIDNELEKIKNPTRRRFLQIVLFSKIASVNNRDYQDFATDLGYCHSNYSGNVNRFFEAVHKSMVTKFDIKKLENNKVALKKFKESIPDILFLIKQVYQDDFTYLKTNSEV